MKLPTLDLSTRPATGDGSPGRVPEEPPAAAPPAVEPVSRPRSAGGALALTIPKQHGAWSILLAGYVLGALAFPGAGGAIPWLVLGAAVCGFIARHGVGAFMRRQATDPRRAAVGLWALGFGAASLAMAALLVVVYDRWVLIPLAVVLAALGIISLLIERARKDRTAWGELIGIVGLSTVVPVAACCVTGALGGKELGLWALAALYFCGSVFHVRYLVRRWRARTGPFPERLRAGLSSVLYHLAALAATGSLAAAGWMPSHAIPAPLPMTLKALWALRRAEGPPAIRAVGFIELGHSLLFALLVTVAFRLQA